MFWVQLFVIVKINVSSKLGIVTSHSVLRYVYWEKRGLKLVP